MLHRGAYSIVLSRRITGEDGGFLGVVAGSIRFSYFHELFDRLNLDRDDTITVLRRDRTIIMRKPFDLDVIGKNLATVPSLEPEQSEERRLICRTGPGRCDTRGSSSGATAAGPLYVVVGKPLRRSSASGSTEAIRIGAIMLALILFVLGTDAVPRARDRPPRRRPKTSSRSSRPPTRSPA